jgi:hypothetical protein
LSISERVGWAWTAQPGSKEWFMPLLREAYPHLEPAYARLYRRTYPDQDYTQQVLRVVNEARRRCQLPVALPPRRLQGPQGRLQLALSA